MFKVMKEKGLSVRTGLDLPGGGWETGGLRLGRLISARGLIL